MRCDPHTPNGSGSTNRLMKAGSITIKLLSLVITAVLITVVSVLLVANHQLVRIIDENQNEVYTEKVDVIWNTLEQSESRLQKTGRVAAYIEGFQDSALTALRNMHYTSIGPNVYPFIVDLEGHVIMHPEVPKGDHSLQSHDVMQNMLARESGSFTSTYQGQEKWYIFRRFSPWNWVIGYAIPLETKYADLHRFQRMVVVIISGISIAVLGILSFLLARFIKPIVSLTRISAQIADGNLDQTIDLAARDEVGTLARSFDHMRNAIKEKITALSREIEERKQAEVRLRQSEEHLRTTLNSIGEAVVTTTLEGRIESMNPVAERLTGWTQPEAVGKPLNEIFQTRPPLKYLNAGDPEPESTPAPIPKERTGELHLTARDGSEYKISASPAPILSDADEPRGMVLVFRDITRESALQEQLNQSQKMDAIGQLAGGIAHDFNNMLACISGAAELLEGYLPETNKPAHKYQTMILETAQRAADLTRQLLDFSRNSKASSRRLDAHTIIQKTVSLLQNTVDRRIQIFTDLAARATCVEGDPSLLQSALLNLGINASQAMTQGGIIRITTRNRQLDRAACEASAFNLTPGPYLEIEVRDSGTGIDPAFLTRIFDPFFTTKEQGKGTGLGLSVVFGTVQQHHGAIEVESEPGTGTNIYLLLPLCDEEEVPELNRSIGLAAGSGCILVVEDEESIRNLTMDLLNQLGYEVLLAEDGQQAMEIFSQHFETIDLVLLDMIMPKMNGADCFAAMQQIDPGVSVIISSGYTDGEDLAVMKTAGVKTLIRKPYRIAELSQLIQDILSGKEVPWDE